MRLEPENPAKIIAALDEARRLMAGFPDKAAKIDFYLADWTNKRDAASVRKENVALIERLEKEVQDPAKTTEVRASLRKAERAAITLGKEWEQRVRKIGFAVKLNEFRAALEPIKTHQDAGHPEAALAACDAAVAVFNGAFDPFDPTQDRKLMDLYAELINGSDALATKVETPEFEGKVEARDMLSAKERDLWKAGEGVTFTPTSKAFMMEGVKTDQVNVTGVVSLLPPAARPWNDLVIDLEIIVISGQLEMYLRYGPRTKAYLIRFSPTEGYELDKPYPMTIRIRGSEVWLKHPDQPENKDRFHLTTSRTGGLGFGLKPGSKAVVTKLTMKVLR